MLSPLTDMVLLKVSFFFVHYVECNRRRRYFLGIVGLYAVRSQGRQGEKPSVSCLRRSELSAQVRQHNSYLTHLIVKSMAKKLGWRRGRNVLWCVEDGVCSLNVH